LENDLFDGFCGNSINDKEGKGWWDELIKVLLRDPFELSASKHHCLNMHLIHVLIVHDDEVLLHAVW